MSAVPQLQHLQIEIPAELLSRGTGAHLVHTAFWESTVPDGVTTVCVHGLGGSHLNWSLAAPHLVDRGPVYALDLAGFGMTLPTSPDGGRRGATLSDNLDLLVGFVKTVSPDRPVHLVGNSMGGLLSLMAAARRPRLVEALVLVNPALPAPLTVRGDPRVLINFAAFALPGVGERVLRRRAARLTPEQQVTETMRLCAVDPDGLDRQVLEAHVDLARRRRLMPHAEATFLEASRSVVHRLTVKRSRLWGDIKRVKAPTLLLTGERDRLVHRDAPAGVAKVRTDWTHVAYRHLGHIPQLESPRQVADDIRDWLDRHVEDHVA